MAQQPVRLARVAVQVDGGIWPFRRLTLKALDNRTGAVICERKIGATESNEFAFEELAEQVKLQGYTLLPASVNAADAELRISADRGLKEWLAGHVVGAAEQAITALINKLFNRQ